MTIILCRKHDLTVISGEPSMICEINLHSLCNSMPNCPLFPLKKDRFTELMIHNSVNTKIEHNCISSILSWDVQVNKNIKFDAYDAY